jgi:hypothetical protein
MSVYSITILGTTPIGGPLVGWISQEFGPRYGLAIGGVATLAIILFFARTLLRAPRRVPEDEPASIHPAIPGEMTPVAST